MTKITADLVLEICEDVANGKTLSAAARERDTSPAAIRYHLIKDAELFSVSTRAREAGCDALADECIEIADNPLLDAAEKRVRIDTRIRLIGKWSKRYNDKVIVESNTTVTHKYDLDSLSTDELANLEQILAKSERGKGGDGAAEPASLH